MHLINCCLYQCSEWSPGQGPEAFSTLPSRTSLDVPAHALWEPQLLFCPVFTHKHSLFTSGNVTLHGVREIWYLGFQSWKHNENLAGWDLTWMLTICSWTLSFIGLFSPSYSLCNLVANGSDLELLHTLWILELSILIIPSTCSLGILHMLLLDRCLHTFLVGATFY